MALTFHAHKVHGRNGAAPDGAIIAYKACMRDCGCNTAHTGTHHAMEQATYYKCAGPFSKLVPALRRCPEWKCVEYNGTYVCQAEPRKKIHCAGARSTSALYPRAPCPATTRCIWRCWRVPACSLARQAVSDIRESEGLANLTNVLREDPETA